VERGGSEAHYPRKEVREESGGVAQEGALTLRAPKLLKLGESYDLRIRELLQALVTATIRIDVLVDVVDRAEQNSEGLF
jgi:hypothetical protein